VTLDVDDINVYWQNTVRPKLHEAYIAIVGDSDLALEAAICCSVMEIGHVAILGNGNGYIANKMIPSDGRSTTPEMTAKFIREISPTTDARPYVIDVERDYTSYFKSKDFSGLDIIIDASNSQYSRSCSSRFAKGADVQYIAVGVDGRKGRTVSITSKKEFDERGETEYIEGLPGKIDSKQDVVLAALIGACVADDAFSMYLSKQDVAGFVRDKNNMAIEVWLTPSTSVTVDFSEYESDISGKEFLVGGVGNVGSQAARLLAMKGAKKIVMYDSGKVKKRNIGRQWLYHDSVDMPKASVLRERLTPFGIDIEAHDGVFDGTVDMQCDAYMSCFDKFTPRAWMQMLATKYGKPMTDGGMGGTPHACETVVYVPQKSACLEHCCNGRLSRETIVQERKQKEEARALWDKDGCDGIMHAGAVTRGLAMAALHVELAGRALKSSKLEEIDVSLYEPNRLIVRDVKPSCMCDYTSMLYRWLEVIG